MFSSFTTTSRSPPRDRRVPDRRERCRIYRIERGRLRAVRNRADITRGLLSLGVLILGACAGLYWWSAATARADAERAALAEQRLALRAELLTDGALSAAEARTLLERIEDSRPVWEGASFAYEVRLREAAARRAVEAAAIDRALLAELAVIERQAAACDPEPDAWRALHTLVGGIGGRAGRASAEVQARIGATTERIVTAWFEALVARGTAEGAQPAEATAWLVQAVDLGEDQLAGARGREAARPWHERLRVLAPLFDAAQSRRWTPAAVAEVPWRSLPLLEEEWATSIGGNMTRRLTPAGLALACAAEGRSAGGAVVLRRHDWHDAAIACEVVLERGVAVLLPRVHKQFVPNMGGGIELATEPAGGATVVPAGRPFRLEATVIGDRVVARIDLPGMVPVERRIATSERRGSLGLILRADTAVTIRDLRIRRLD